MLLGSGFGLCGIFVCSVAVVGTWTTVKNVILALWAGDNVCASTYIV
jgi:hypothetical protein